MLRLEISFQNNSPWYDYSRYTDWSSLQITNQLSVPVQMKFNLNNCDAHFVAPKQRFAVRLRSEKHNQTLFTGYVAVTPDMKYVGLDGGKQELLQYAITCTSDEYLLNFKAPPYIPAFINQTQGQILAQLAEILMPDFFDTSGIQPGFLVPYFAYDPTQTWSMYAKQFGDAARYYYFVKDRRIIYAPYGDNTLGIAYDERHPQERWNPSKLSATVLQQPSVNDVTIVGDVEAGAYHVDYYIGDGFTGEWTLKYNTFQDRTSLLLQDDFTQQTMNTQNWTLNDPQGYFDFSAGALNVVSPTNSFAITGQLIANNVLELAGGIELQHGEFQWNDSCTGEVGGLYTDASVLQQICAFDLRTPGTVTLTASGAGGIVVQPCVSGQLIGPAITSQPNHHYTLNTRITAPAESRFQQVYSTRDGQYFGGQQSQVFGDITFSITDVDIGATYNQSLTGIYNYPIESTTLFTVPNVPLPAYAAYALAKNGQLNLTSNYCLLSKTPAGALQIAGSVSGAFLPTGAILPFLGPESEYYGPVSPVLSGQIVLSSGVTGSLAPPTPLEQAHIYTLGYGLDQQTASVTQNNNQDSLGFYLDTTPAAGARIKFAATEAQKAMSRLIDSANVGYEQGLVGDDGHRAAIVSNMQPLPRTSEDCDAAAQAYIYDHSTTYYNGTYTAESDLFHQQINLLPYFPNPGRFLSINSAARGLSGDFLVSEVDTTVLSPTDEILSFQISFGADPRTEKLLANFVASQPTNILVTQDSATTPTGQTLSQIVTGTYLPDLTDTDCPYIVDSLVTVNINSPLLTGQTPNLSQLTAGRKVTSQIEYVPLNILNYDQAVNKGVFSAVAGVSGVATAPALPGTTCVEIRLSNQYWGQNSSNLVLRTTQPSFSLTKNNYDQVWYVRLVHFDLNNQPIMVSRRPTVIRVQYPFRPSPPNVIYATSTDMQLDFAGDQRNIYGVELRAGDDATVVYQQSADDTTDLYFDLQSIYPQIQQIAASENENNGTYLRGYHARFFNAQWLYSDPTQISIPVPPPPVLGIGVRFSQMLQITSDVLTDRDDIVSQSLDVAYDSQFQNVMSSIMSDSQPGTWSLSVPSTGDLFVRSKRYDLIGPSNYSQTLHIPQGNLIASDYLATQGSAAPIVTNSSGALFSYQSTSNSIKIVSVPFSVVFANGYQANVPAGSWNFTQSMSPTGTANLVQSTPYSYFPLINNPLNPGAMVEVDALYSDIPTNFYQTLIQDGTVLLTTSALTASTVAQTVTGSSGVGTGSGGGSSGGGSGGGSSCIEENELITMADGSKRRAGDLLPGHLVMGPETVPTKVGIVKRITGTQLYRVTTATGRTLLCSESHALKVNKRWGSVLEIAERLADGELLLMSTDTGVEQLTDVTLVHQGSIIALKLWGPHHMYFANGFLCHNYLYKAQSPGSQ